MMDVAECPVCYQEFDRPLQLSCGHTVCAGCVDRMVNSEQQVDDNRARARGVAAELHAEILGRARLQHHLPGINEPPRIFQQRDYQRDLNQHDANGNGDVGGLGGGFIMQQPFQFQPPDFWIPPVPQRMALPMRFQPAEPELGYPHRAVRATLRQRVNKIRCPECRSMTEVPATGLPVNYRLKEMIERMKKEKDAETSLSQLTFAMICSECDKEVEKGVYFVCGACPDKARICSLCIVRLHLRHSEQIVERKALTEQDLMDRLEKVNQDAAVATQTTINVGNVIDRLNDCGADLKQVLDKSQRTFSEISSNLRQINRNSTMEEADVYVTVAAEISEIFKQMEKKVMEVRKDLVNHLENLSKEFNEKITMVLRGSPLATIKREIKGEPEDNEEDIVVIESQDDHTYRQRPDEVHSPLRDLFRRSPTPYPEVADEGIADAAVNNDHPPAEGTSSIPNLRIYAPHTPQRPRDQSDDLQAVQPQVVPDDALDLITNRARHIRVARTPSPNGQSPQSSPPRRRRRNESGAMVTAVNHVNAVASRALQRRYPTQALIDRSKRRRGRVLSAVYDSTPEGYDQPGPSNR